MEHLRSLVTSPREAAWRVQAGDTVVLGPGASLPYSFMDAVAERNDLRGVTIIGSMTLEPPRWMVKHARNLRDNAGHRLPFRYLSFFPGPADKEAWQMGLVDQMPAARQDISVLFRSGKPFQVLALSSPGTDDQGNFNLGPNVDYLQELLSLADERDGLVIVEVNRQLPFTSGETGFRRELVDHIIQVDRPVPELLTMPAQPEDRIIARRVAELVPDGATLTIGSGSLVDRVLRSLSGKRDLGVFSPLLTDGLLFLGKQGAITNRKKGFMDRRWVAASVAGSRDLYDFVDHNEAIHLTSAEFLLSRSNIQRNRTPVAITAAAEVDLLGQVASDMTGERHSSSTGTTADIHAAAAGTPGGSGLVVLRSTWANGKRSSIVSSLSPGVTVSIPYQEVDSVVTEYGLVRLRGRSRRERAMALISIAHPDHQEQLMAEADRLGLT